VFKSGYRVSRLFDFRSGCRLEVVIQCLKVVIECLILVIECLYL